MSLINPAPTGRRNGLPEPTGYVYRGTGEDTLTGDLGTQQLKKDIAAAEGAGYAPPLRGRDALLPDHGTWARYQWHRKYDEKACHPCMEAAARKNGNRKAKVRA